MDYILHTKKIVLKHFDTAKYEVFLFGSRAAGNAKFHSDIDVGILGNEQLNSIQLAELENDLEESIVPFKVDIVDFYRVEEKFKHFALQHIVKWS
jgi:predicted nucleotidyltransferase